MKPQGIWVQCCQCRRIRDSKGRWYFEDEATLTSFNESGLSHGLCHDCGGVAQVTVQNRRAKKDLEALKGGMLRFLFR